MVECKTIFYDARKTALCERTLKESISGLDLNMNEVLFATDKNTLGALLEKAFGECDTVFIIGGLGFDDRRNAADIVSGLLSSNCIDECKKLKNVLGNDGYVIRANRQLLFLLPDEPKQISAIMQNTVAKYFKFRENARV